MIERVTLIILDGYNPLTSMVESCYFGTHGFTSSPTDNIPDTYFEPIISNPGMFSQSIYSVGTTGGQSSGGWGFVEMINPAGEFDYLADWGFDGRRCVILNGPANGSLADFSTIMTGTVEQIEFSWDKITLRFKDKVTELDKPVALNYYLGNNVLPDGVEGGVLDILGTPKPRILGVVFHMVPVCINTSKLAYQVNDGPITTVTVRDSGVPLTVGTLHADVSSLMAATVVAGTVDKCLSAGMFRVGSTPNELTCLSKSGTTTVGQIIRKLVLEKIGASSICEQSIIDLDKLYPSSTLIICYTGTAGKKDVDGNISGVTTTKQILDELCQAGLWWGFDNNGVFWVKQLTPPETGRPLTELDQSNILSVERIATQDSNKGVPVWKVTVNYLKNHKTDPVLAGSITADQTDVYKKPHATAVAQDPTIKIKHPLASELVIDSPFYINSPAEVEAARQLAMRSVRRDRLKVSVPADSIKYPAEGYWDDEAITEVPKKLYASSSAYDGTCLYILGGIVSGSFSKSVYRLNLDVPTGAWETLPDLPSGLWQGQFSVVYGGYLYVFLSQQFARNTYRLNLSNPIAWDSAGVSDLVNPYSFGDNFVVHQNYVYCLQMMYDYSSVPEIWRLDLDNPTTPWEEAFNVTVPDLTLGSYACAVYGDYLYIFGGSHGVTPTAVVKRMNLTFSMFGWETMPSLPQTRRGASACTRGSYVYILGGAFSDPYSPTDTCLRLDLDDTSKGWETVANLPVALNGALPYNHKNSIYSATGQVSSTLGVGATYRLRTNDNPDDVSHLTSLGRTVSVKLPRYGYTAGKNMKIIGVELDQSTRKIALDLWG